jgi:dephospho-CoA kinase
MASSSFKIGITGGIGSGKTTASRFFATLGVPVYYADERAKWLMTHDTELKQAIRSAFGEAAYEAGGALNREYLAREVFNDPKRLLQLNALVHPAVGRDGLAWHEAQRGAPYTLKEAALLFESGAYRLLDRVIVVYAPRALRIERVMRRDGVDQAAVEARMARQMPEEDKLALADHVIYNDGSRALIPQVWALHRQLLALGEKS